MPSAVERAKLARAALALNARSALPSLILMTDEKRLRDPAARAPGPLALALWFALPILGLLLSVLPALEAHLRLLAGRPLSYEVTRKQVAATPRAPLAARVLRDRSAV